jgi:transcriptional regulator with GAF, ATPase, and Fis domain
MLERVMNCASWAIPDDRDLRVVDPRRRFARNRTADLVCQSDAMRRVVADVSHVAPTGATVLLLGETGVGKEVVAQAIHDTSPRRSRPMVGVSCAALPATLVESELFGHEPGAFTGAASRKIGRFEAASGSTLFLDEIGEVPLEVQVKLLRVLQEKTIERLGAGRACKVDVRIIAATNRDLEAAVVNKTFREDLFYRLNVFPISIPPLRERVPDILPLAWTFIEEMASHTRQRIQSIASTSRRELEGYHWPGNVRELRNVIERAMIVATGPVLVPRVPAAAARAAGPSVQAGSERLADVQADHIRAVLNACGWRIRGAKGAAERLGVKPTTLESRMARLGIVKKQRVASEA